MDDDDIEELRKLDQYIATYEDDDLQKELDGILINSDAEDEDDGDILNEIENDLKGVEGVYVNCTELNRSVYLTNEEKEALDKCDDPVLKKLLLLNRMKNNQLKDTYKQIYSLYSKVSRKIEVAKTNLSEKYPQGTARIKSTPCWKLGTPYFKDKYFFRAPPNADVKKKRDANEFMSTSFTAGRRWTLDDQTMLKSAVIFNYTEQCKKKLTEELTTLKASMKSEDCDEKDLTNRKIVELNEELNSLKYDTKSKVPPLNGDEGINWEDISTNDLKSRHLPLECQAFWNIFLHPDINKSNWTKEEDTMIKDLAEKYDYQYWDEIAAELGTNRTAFVTCVHFYTALCDRFKRARFTIEEDEHLLKVVESCRIGAYIPWAKVACFFKNRSRKQLYHRYKYYLSSDSQCGAFSIAEDVLLLCLIRRFGKNFTACAQYMPNRTPVQLRNRYSCYLRRSVRYGNFTLEEDEKIVEHVEKNGTGDYATLADQLGRNRAHVRHRYLRMKNWMVTNNSKDLSKIRRPVSCIRYNDLEKIAAIADTFDGSKEVPTLEMITAVTGCTIKSQHEKRTITVTQKQTVDTELLEFFIGSCRTTKMRKNAGEEVLKQTALDIVETMRILAANVEIPSEEELKGYSQLNAQDHVILKLVKEELEKTNSTLPSTSEMIDTRKVSNVLVPTVSSILGFRGMILHYNLYKKHIGPLFVNSKKTLPADSILWRLQNYLHSLEKDTEKTVTCERNLFFQRMYAIFKWPSILSKKFPTNYSVGTATSSAKVDSSTTKRKVGRPRRDETHKKCFEMVSKRRKIYDFPKTFSNADEGTSANTSEQTDNDIKKLDQAIASMTNVEPTCSNSVEDDVWKSVEEDLRLLEAEMAQ